MSSSTPFIRASHLRFLQGDREYRFVGANLWYAVHLASKGPGGDRARLDRELDRLQALGLSNLRIMASSEGSEGALEQALPTMQPHPGQIDEAQLDGLDYLLQALAQRGMHAVVCLNNFWQWSGGFAQYLHWTGAGEIPYPSKQSWQAFESYVERFYENEQAQLWFRAFVRRLIERRNRYNGLVYRDDPTIMAWELANEARGKNRVRRFRDWIHETAAFIKSLDRNHMVTTGSEGDTPHPWWNGTDVQRDHQSPFIDYITFHLWVENWGWYDPKVAETSFATAMERARSYIASHLEAAVALGKPIVLEEFGIARDGRQMEASAPAEFRARYYRQILSMLMPGALTSEGAAGANFWAWSGEGRPAKPGGMWRVGDPWLGDPAHEEQGWYGVYDEESATLEVLRDFAERARNHR